VVAPHEKAGRRNPGKRRDMVGKRDDCCHDATVRKGLA
jgi:hypothetical protein